MFPADGWVGARIVKGKHESYGYEGRTRVWHLNRKRRKAGVVVRDFLLRDYVEFFSFFCYHGGRQGDREMCVEESGHE